MSDTVSSSAQDASELAQDIKEALDNYTSYNFLSIGKYNAACGSAVHDSFKGGIREALRAWKDLIDSDASAIKKAAASVDGLDARIARGLMGVGG